MTKKTLKKEYQPGGEKRYVILEKAVQYLKDPRFGLQGDKHSFLTGELGLSESEYLTCLNDAAGGDCWQSWVEEFQIQWCTYTTGNGSRPMATSNKRQAASAKRYSWQENIIVL